MREKCVASGNKYFQNGKYKEASILYRRALQLDPKYADAYYRLGLTQLALKNYSEAVRSLQRASDLDPAIEDAQVRLTEIYLAAYIGNPQSNKQALAEARQIVDRMLSRNPKSYDALRLDADLATASNDRERAIRGLRDANAVKPWQPATIMALVQNLMATGRPREAEQLGREFIARNKTYGPVYDFLSVYYMHASQPERVEEILKQKVANLPLDGFSQIQLAAFYFAQGRKDEMRAALYTLRSGDKKSRRADALIGDFYAHIGEFDLAIQSYREGEKNLPELRAVLDKHIAEVLIAQGKSEEALRIASQLHKDYPKDAEASAIYASLLAKGSPQQLQAAIGQLESLLAQEPGNSVMHLNLGRAYMSKGDRDSLDRAHQHFQTSVSLNRDSLVARLALADVQLARGQDRDAVQIAEEILKLNPGNLQARLIRAAALAKAGDVPRAREELNSILRANKDANEARFRLAWIDLAEKRYSEAEAGFLALVRAGDLRGVTGLARCKDAQGQPAAAAQLLERELEKMPERDEFRLALVDVEYRAGRFQDARAELERLARKRPDSAEILLRLGDVQNRLGDRPAAIQTFRRVHQLKPADLSAAVGLAVMLDASGQNELARAAYQDVLRIDPENPQALNNLAYMKAQEGVDLDQALSFVQRALRRTPNDPNLADTLGLIYIRKKLTGQALQVLRDLVVKEPDNPAFHMHLGMALYDAGEKQLAKKELESALRHKPSPTDQTKIKELVARIG